MEKLVTVKNGKLVRLKHNGEIVMASIPEVGHLMKAGAIIIDGFDEPVAPKEMRVRHMENGIPFQARVIDPGPQYSVCFLLNTEPHLARLFKA